MNDLQKGGVSCPVCRQLAAIRDITVVGPKLPEKGAKEEDKLGRGFLDEEEASIHVQGSYGTKVGSEFPSQELTKFLHSLSGTLWNTRHIRGAFSLFQHRLGKATTQLCC